MLLEVCGGEWVFLVFSYAGTIMTFREGDSMKAVRVLIVDDHRDGADSLGLLIEDLGHEVKVTYGGRHALSGSTAQTVRSCPDLLVSIRAGESEEVVQ